MGFDKTSFPHFYAFCVDKFGPDAAEKLRDIAKNKLTRMIRESDDKGNKYIRWHLHTNMLPAIAIYLAFKEYGATADKAYEYTDEVMQISRIKMRDKNQPLGRLPFGYALFRAFCKPVMNKQYPAQGWEVEWKQYNKREIHFDMKTCIYHDTTKRYSCEEICPLFCANDDVIFTGYQPAVVFERSGTIARGQAVCDFHFKNPRCIR